MKIIPVIFAIAFVLVLAECKLSTIRILNVADGGALDVQTKDGAEVRVWSNINTKNQRWIVDLNEAVSNFAYFEPLAQDGGRIKVLDEDVKLHTVATWGFIDTPTTGHQYWSLVPVNEFWQLKNYHTNRCIVFAQQRIQLTTSDCDRSDTNQLWSLTDFSDGSDNGIPIIMPPTTTTTTSTTTTTTVAPPTTSQPCAPKFTCPGQADGNYINRGDCGSFVQCSNGNTHIMGCPSGLHFKPTGFKEGYCDWPEQAKCDWNQLLPNCNNNGNNAAVDLTLVPKAYGRDVVVASLDKIESCDLGTDVSFAFRIAYVETRYGEDKCTFRDGYYGGIWAVDEAIYNESKNRDPALYAIILNKFGINWMATTWKDCLKPLYSALATRLFFSGSSIPVNYADQGDLWKQKFNSRPEDTKEKFVRDCRQVEDNKYCVAKMDFVTLLDASGSIGEGNFIVAKDFVGDLVTKIHSGPSDDSRDAYVTFSNDADTKYDLISGKSLSEKQEIIKNTNYDRGMTYTGKGIYEAMNSFHGATDRPEVPKVLGIFTDGASTNAAHLKEAIEETKLQNITTLSIGIGGGINQNELKMMAHENDNHVFLVTSYNELHYFLDQFTSYLCKIPQNIAPNNPIDGTLGLYMKRFYKLSVPENGIHFKIDQGQSGKVRGFYSFSVENPNSAIHDGEIDIQSGSLIKRPTCEFKFVYICIEGISIDQSSYTITI